MRTPAEVVRDVSDSLDMTGSKKGEWGECSQAFGSGAPAAQSELFG